MVETSLKDPRRFREGLDILQSQDFQKKDIKRVFNAYSDNIYYLVSSTNTPLGYYVLMAKRGKFSCQTATTVVAVAGLMSTTGWTQ